MLSIVVPVYDEVDSLMQLHREIDDTCRKHEIDTEVVFVDDGSQDGSWDIIRQLAADDARVTGIRFRRNFGKAAALTVGMEESSGDLIMMLDADLQDDPAEIPGFLAKLEEGYDVVNGWKQRRFDPWHKVYPSKVFNWLVSATTGLVLHDHNCGLKLFRAEVTREIRIYGELHRFIPVFAHSRGFKVAEKAVHHRERQFGRSKYGIKRFLRGFLDLLTVKFLTAFGQRPQHMFGAVGLILFLLGVLGLGYLTVVWLITQLSAQTAWIGLEFTPIGDRPLLAYSVALTLLGAQAISLGLLAELIVAYTGHMTDNYSVAERTGATGSQSRSSDTP